MNKDDISEHMTLQLLECENSLFEELVAVILLLNSNGVPIKEAKSMINKKVDTAFFEYKNRNILEKFKKEMEDKND